MILLVVIVLGGFASVHAQDWNCTGPQPAVSGRCVVLERQAPRVPPEVFAPDVRACVLTPHGMGCRQ